MKLIPKWQDKLLRCHFCGTNKSVKYAELEKKIAFMKGQICAFQFCVSH